MNTDNSLDNFFNINIDHEARQYLKTASTWARIVAILGFVASGISILQTVVVSSTRGIMFAGSSILGTLVVVAISVILNVLLLRFARNLSAGLSNMNQGQIDEGINNLRIYFKAVGILMIIALSLCILAILLLGVVGSLGR